MEFGWGSRPTFTDESFFFSEVDSTIPVRYSLGSSSRRLHKTLVELKVKLDWVEHDWSGQTATASARRQGQHVRRSPKLDASSGKCGN